MYEALGSMLQVRLRKPFVSRIVRQKINERTKWRGMLEFEDSKTTWGIRQPVVAHA